MTRSTSGSFFPNSALVLGLPALKRVDSKAASPFATSMDCRYREDGEVAQPVAGAFLSPGLCRSWRALFSALGHPKTFRNHFVCWRRAFACSAGTDTCLCCWRRYADEHGLVASCGF